VPARILPVANQAPHKTEGLPRRLSVARNITQRFSTKIPAEFGDTFSYGKVFYSMLENVPVTVEA
jgi:hypothetical protein